MGRSTKTTGGAGLTLGMIRAVSEAVRTRSMTEAALVLGVSQSAVTQQVNKFEVLTGLKVLSRVGNTLFVEREDVANLMERISVLSAHMDRILQDGSRKQTLALPYSISALITVDPALAAWTADRFHCEAMGFRDLAHHCGQNAFNFVLRPLRPRETEFDYQFECQFQMLRPQPGAFHGDNHEKLPVMLPGGDCPTRDAAIDFLQRNNLPFGEVGRSEDLTSRALNLTLGLSATLLPKGFADHSTHFAGFANCPRVGEPFGVRFGLQGIQTGYGRSMASAFFEEFCGKLNGHGVAING